MKSVNSTELQPTISGRTELLHGQTRPPLAAVGYQGQRRLQRPPGIVDKQTCFEHAGTIFPA
jgi:hypothetical protein